MKLTVYNRSGSTLALIIEPSALAYEIGPGKQVLIEGSFTEPSGFGELEVDDGNTLSLYLEPGATVLEDGKPAKRVRDF